MEGSECDADKLDDLSTVEISSEIWTGEVPIDGSMQTETVYDDPSLQYSTELHEIPDRPDQDQDPLQNDTAFEDEVDRVINHLHSSGQAISESAEYIESLQRERLELLNGISTLQSQHAELTNKHQQAQTDLIDRATRLEALELRCEALEKERDLLKQYNSQLSEKLFVVNVEREEKESTIKNLQGVIMSLERHQHSSCSSSPAPDQPLSGLNALVVPEIDECSLLSTADFFTPRATSEGSIPIAGNSVDYGIVFRQGPVDDTCSSANQHNITSWDRLLQEYPLDSCQATPTNSRLLNDMTLEEDEGHHSVGVSNEVSRDEPLNSLRNTGTTPSSSKQVAGFDNEGTNRSTTNSAVADITIVNEPCLCQEYTADDITKIGHRTSERAYDSDSTCMGTTDEVQAHSLPPVTRLSLGRPISRKNLREPSDASSNATTSAESGCDTEPPSRSRRERRVRESKSTARRSNRGTLNSVSSARKNKSSPPNRKDTADESSDLPTGNDPIAAEDISTADTQLLIESTIEERQPGSGSSQKPAESSKSASNTDRELKRKIQGSYSKFGLKGQLCFQYGGRFVSYNYIDLKTNWKEKSILTRELWNELEGMLKHILEFIPSNIKGVQEDYEKDLITKICYRSGSNAPISSLRDIAKSLYIQQNCAQDESNYAGFEFYSILIIMRYVNESEFPTVSRDFTKYKSNLMDVYSGLHAVLPLLNESWRIYHTLLILYLVRCGTTHLLRYFRSTTRPAAIELLANALNDSKRNLHYQDTIRRFFDETRPSDRLNALSSPLARLQTRVKEFVQAADVMAALGYPTEYLEDLEDARRVSERNPLPSPIPTPQVQRCSTTEVRNAPYTPAPFHLSLNTTALIVPTSRKRRAQSDVGVPSNAKKQRRILSNDHDDGRR